MKYVRVRWHRTALLAVVATVVSLACASIALADSYLWHTGGSGTYTPGGHSMTAYGNYSINVSGGNYFHGCRGTGGGGKICDADKWINSWTTGPLERCVYASTPVWANRRAAGPKRPPSTSRIRIPGQAPVGRNTC